MRDTMTPALQVAARAAAPELPPEQQTAVKSGKPLRVLYHHRIASSDGQFTHIDEMVRALRALGAEVLVVGPEVHKSDSGQGGSPGWVGALKAVLPAAVYEVAEAAYALVAYRRLRRAVASFRPDVIYERYALYQPAGVWVSRRTRVPLLLEVNAPYVIEKQRYGKLRLRWLASRFERYTLTGATRVFPVTQVLGDMLVGMGVSRERVAVIPNAIDPNNFQGLPTAAQAKTKLGLSGRTVVGFIGFVREWDQLDRIVDWLARRPERDNTVLLVVGDGWVRPQLEEQARRLGVAHKLHFTGVLPRHQVPAAAASFDVALQTALVPYASPLCLFEYMALGKAIVAPDQPNHHEVLRKGTDCVMYQPERQGSLEEAIETLVDDPAQCERLGAAARDAIMERQLHWSGNASRVTSVAHDVLLARASTLPNRISAAVSQPPRTPGRSES